MECLIHVYLFYYFIFSNKVEDTPVTFSRNSSLSSLSVSSNDDEPSPEDQALLDSCISSAMPKSKSDLANRPPSLDLNSSVFIHDFIVVVHLYIEMSYYDLTLFDLFGRFDSFWFIHVTIRLETMSCRILPLTYVTKYDMT